MNKHVLALAIAGVSVVAMADHAVADKPNPGSQPPAFPVAAAPHWPCNWLCKTYVRHAEHGRRILQLPIQAGGLF